MIMTIQYLRAAVFATLVFSFVKRKGSDPGPTPLFSLFFISSEEELRQELEFERDALVSAESNNL